MSRLQQTLGILTGNLGKLPHPENTPLIRRAAAEGIVLLENDGTLPMQAGKIALFGAGAAGTVYCGTGSGYVFTPHPVTVQEGLKNAGFRLTSSNWLKRCTDHERLVNKQDKTLSWIDRKWSGVTILAEEPEITAEDMKTAQAETAVYVIRRNAGEGGDRKAEKGDWLLSDRERENLTAVARHYAHTVVVLNTCAMDLRFVQEIPGISAVVYMGLGGMEMGNALADVLTGRVNPCGKLTDTLAARYEDYPTAGHFADQDGSQLHPMYTEGIYVGYRYFDSFGVKPFYPFGYGRSYTDFELKTISVSCDWDKISACVQVTNTGKYAGKEVVQLYVSAPGGKLEKPYQELKAFAKTPVLQPGESRQIRLEVKTALLASFDESRSAWIMEQGNYLLRVGTSSVHTGVAATISLDGEAIVSRVTDILAVDVPIEEIHAPQRAEEAAQGIVLELRAAQCVTQDHTSKLSDSVTTYVPEGSDYTSSVNDNPYKPAGFCREEIRPVRNCPHASFYDVAEGKVTMEEFVASLPNEVLVRICTGILEETPFAVPDRTGVKLKKLAVAQSSGATTAQYEKTLGIPPMQLIDGPGGMHIIGCAAAAFPVGMVLAQTWNMELIEQIGQAYAHDMETYHVTVGLAPGMNIHRDPLCGRNFEYYSEDPLLAGKVAAAMTRGIQYDGKRGVAIKHFAANNQETDRFSGMNTVSPRALREIYLKNFEICVRESRPMTVMTSYNGINGVHTSSRRDLVTHLLRGEWGFDGFVMTDWGTQSEKPLDLQAGNDIIMGGYCADWILEATVHKDPIFTEDGAVVETVNSKHGGLLKSTHLNWGSFLPQKGGRDTVSTTVVPGKKLHERVRQAVADGYARIEKHPDGSKTVTYCGVDRGIYLARGTLQECAMRILHVLLHSAAMDDLKHRRK